MSIQNQSLPAEPRRPHTFYLSASVWNELERRYLEQRLAGGAASKIVFLEELLRSGLAASTPTGAGSTPPIGRDRKTSADRLPAPDDPDQPNSSPRAADLAAASAPAAPPDSTPSPSRPRSSAINRLRQASDPGRPAPIDSAAPLRDVPPADT